MFRKAVVIILLLIVSNTASTWASDAYYYITVGRTFMFDGTLSGLRLAHETFDNGLNDTGCPDCDTSRELRFLHAVTGTAMLVIRDDNSSVDSIFELAKQFGIEVLGDYWAAYFEPSGLDLSIPRNQYDAYEIPEGAPDANEIRNIIDTSMIPEIEALIADLNSISDSPGDRFKIFLEPDEVRIFFHPDSSVYDPGSSDYDPNSRFLYPLEVDYGEVLLLKGMLIALKAELEAQLAYDIFVDANNTLIEKVYGDSLNINDDLLEPYPDLLKVLPTPNCPDVNGKAILAQAAYDVNDAINYYLDAIKYISAEANDPCDPQDDEFLYIDPADKTVSDAINNRLIILRDSLANDTNGTYPWETTKAYLVEDPCSTTTWELKLRYNLIAYPADDPGSFVASDNNSAPSPWEVMDIYVDGNEIILEMDYDVPGYWGGALFTGILSDDNNNITNGTFEYWGPDYGTLYDLSGQLTNVEVVEKQFDPNPIFGSSVRYPDPVNPRDLLPEFDEWNGAQPGTVGHGLGDDATLDGSVPDMSQYDWQVMFDLQPGGLFYLDFISPWQVIVDGNTTDWNEDQLVLADIVGDTEEDSNEVNGVDIENLYMAYDWENVYGAITLYDNIGDGTNYYNLYMSYSPEDDSTLGAIRLEIYVSGSFASGSLYNMDAPYGYTYWNYVTSFEASAGQDAIEFKVPFSDLPADLPGRFIAVESSGWDSTWYEYDGEENLTHLRIGDVGTVSGTVSYIGYRGAPIFVQAFTDPEEPGETIVASTMLTEPGPYILEGVGLGWRGYVRAFTHLFGFNVFDLDALSIESRVPVFLMDRRLDGVDIVLNNPTLLEKDVWESGEINADIREEDWYAFDAVQGGTYTLDLTRGTSNYASLTLFDRNGYEELEELYYWQTQQIIWLCPVSGRYYVNVADGYYLPDGGTYQVRMTSDLTCPEADIASADWVGVKDCRVDFYDLKVLVSNWLNSCSEPYWCGGSDFDESGSVDFVDFAAIANDWLVDNMP